MPIGACASTPTSTLRVVCAWVPPGEAVFTPDGGLPSDGDGRVLSWLALVIVSMLTLTWSRRRWRGRALRLLARLRRAALRRRAELRLTVVGCFAISLIIAAVVGRRGIDDHLAVGAGLRSPATVSVRPTGGAWEDCPYSALRGRHTCPTGADVFAAVETLLGDEQPGWRFLTPVIRIETMTPIDIRISFDAHLAGRYWATGTGSLDLDLGDGPSPLATQRILTIPDLGTRTVTITGNVTTSAVFTLIRDSTLL